MEIKEFAMKVQRAVSVKLGEDYEIRVQEVVKNNGVVLQGLIILRESGRISPTIYLNPFWEAYEGGVTLAEIVERILSIYREEVPAENVDLSFFREFSRVKDRICYRLIHREKNSVFLERVPHIPVLDLAVCFYYAYEGEELGCGTILIHDTHMEMWHTDTAELMDLARENTPRLFPWECNSIDSVIRDLLEEERDGEGNEDFDWGVLAEAGSMQILSNRNRVNGAVCMLYPGVLGKLAEQFESGFYILPSSVHEVILLPDRGQRDPDMLREMVWEVNRTQLEPEEVLSDSLYYYGLEGRKLEII